MDQFGQNAFAPGMKSSVFSPDQLIAGTLQLVTDTGTITGGVYKRGTVLGKITASGKYTVSVKTATDGARRRRPFWLMMLTLPRMAISPAACT